MGSLSLLLGWGGGSEQGAAATGPQNRYVVPVGLNEPFCGVITEISYRLSFPKQFRLKIFFA